MKQSMDEYAVSVEGNVVTAYIASEAGQVCSCTIYYAYVFISYLAQRFEIIWEVGECDESARAELRMDGNFVRQRLHNHRSGGREHTFNGVQVDHTSFRPFVFQEWHSRVCWIPCLRLRSRRLFLLAFRS